MKLLPHGCWPTTEPTHTDRTAAGGQQRSYNCCSNLTNQIQYSEMNIIG